MGLSGDWTAERQASLVARILSGELSIKAACEQHSLTADCIRQWVLTYRRSVREAFDAQLSRSLAAQGIDAAVLTENEFTASLAHLSVADLLQTVAHGRKDATITISHGGSESRIWCAEGDIIDAESGRLTGAQAVYRILGIEEGQLHSNFQAVQRPRVVHAPSSALLLEAARRSDESRRLRAGFAAPDTVYEPVRGALTGAVSDPVERTVLGLFETGRSIEQALDSSERGELETLQAISLLLEQGFLMADEQLTRTRQSQPRLESPPMSSPVSALLVHVQSATPERARPRVRKGVPRVAFALVSLGSLGASAWLLGVRSAQTSPPASSVAHPARLETYAPPPSTDLPDPSPAGALNRERSGPGMPDAPSASIVLGEEPPRREASPQPRRTPAKAPPRPAGARSAPARATQPPGIPATSPRGGTPLRAPAIEVISDREPRVEVID